MAIVFSAIVPHPPLLIPNIGKENTAKLAATQKSYDSLVQKAVAAGVETLIIISPHGLIYDQAYSLNVSSKFQIDFSEFGDLVTKQSIAGDWQLAATIKENLEVRANVPLLKESKLDFGSAVPAYFFAAASLKFKFLALYNSNDSLNANFAFGKLLGQELTKTKQKIGLIASTDLSQKLSKPGAKKFDAQIVELLKADKVEEFLALDEKLITQTNQCGARAIALFLGAISRHKLQPRFLSYEAPFGTGYLALDYA